MMESVSFANMRIHYLLHDSFEQPAAIETWARKKNHKTSFTRFYEGDKLPLSSKDIDLLIIMGGSQSTTTTVEECPYFDSKSEIAFINNAINDDIFVLGICLGAQLIAEAFGAQTVKSPHKEIGFFELEFSQRAKDDPFVSVFPQGLIAGHWHSDMPGLTENAIVLAKSEGCPRQIVKFTPKVYALQCHLEFDVEAIEAMIENNSGDFTNRHLEKYVQSKNTLKAFDFTQMNTYLFKFLDKIEESLYKET